MWIKDQLEWASRYRKRHKRFLHAERQFHETLLSLGPGDIAIDCGANVGHYTRYLARTGATVYAFEPDPVPLARLKEVVAPYPNVTLMPVAAGAQAGTVTLRRAANFADNPLGKSAGSSVVAGSSELDDKMTMTVGQIDFIAFLAGLPKPASVVKMDIEGSEVGIVERLIAEKRFALVKHLFVETHERTYPALRARTLNLIRYTKQHQPDWNLDWS